MISLILSFLMMLVPAYLVTRLFFKTNLLTTIAISIGFTLTTSIISGFLLNLMVISQISVWTFYIILISILYSVSSFKKIRLFPNLELNKKELIILLIALILASLIVYIPRADYRFPNHGDEWNHLSYATEIIETGSLFNNPYDEDKKYNLETGTHIFLAEIFLLSDSELVTDYKFLPIIFIFLTSLILFITLYRITNNFWASILSILFLVALKSNANILGILLFTPFSMAFPIVFLFLFLFSTGIRKDKTEYVVSSIVLLGTIVLFHASTAIILGIVAFFYMLFNIDYIKKHYTFLSIASFLLILSGIIFSKFKWGLGVFETINKVLGYSFPLGVTYTYNYILFYGVIASLLAFLGLLISFKSKKLRIYSLMWILLFFYYMISYILPYTLYIEYIRLFYLLMISSVVLSCLGAYYIINFLSGCFAKKYIKIIVTFIIIFIIILFQFSYYYNPDIDDPRNLRSDVHRYIDEDDYNTLIWLKDSDIKNKRIFSNVKIGSAIPLSFNYPSIRLQMKHGSKETIDDSNTFFKNTSCEKKMELLQKYRSDYLFSKARINCDFLELTYKDKDYIYSIIYDDLTKDGSESPK